MHEILWWLISLLFIAVPLYRNRKLIKPMIMEYHAQIMKKIGPDKYEK